MMSESEIKYIIARVIENANDANEESKAEPDDDFYKGRKMAYYEILDTIKSELKARGQDLKEYGLDVNFERKYL